MAKKLSKRQQAAKELFEQMEVIKDWKPSTYEVNIKWLKMYLQPKLDKLYETENHKI